MTIKIVLLDFKDPTPEGYPLVVKFSHKQQRKNRRIGFSHPHHFLEEEQIVSGKHPDADILNPIIADVKLRARRVIMQNFTDVEKAMREVFKVDFSEILFMDCGRNLITEMNDVAAKLPKAALKKKNQIFGNVKVYENVLSQFESFSDGVTLKNIDYEVLMRFRNYQTGIGNAKSTVHLYLRTLRAIYNKSVLLYKVPDEKPFIPTLFKGLKTKSYHSKKKHLDGAGLEILQSLELKSAKMKYVELWLLQFYFAGCDLIDIYYMKRSQIRRGRVYFERGKLEDSYLIDLKIHPKAQAILDKYAGTGEYIFPWEKDKDKYETFRRTYQRALVYIQTNYKVDVLPLGGNIGAKVARHTFANQAKKLRIDEDIIRELMGHERDEVDNYYKEKFPESVRDQALFDIICI